MKPTQTFGAKVTLLVMNNDGDRKEHELRIGRGVFIGKSGNCAIQLSGSNISDIHCRLELNDSGLKLNRWLSATGIRVNTVDVEGDVMIEPSDVIQIGNYEVRILTHDTDSTSTDQQINHSSHGLRSRTDKINPDRENPNIATHAASSLDLLSQYLNEASDNTGRAASETSMARPTNLSPDISQRESTPNVSISENSSEQAHNIASTSNSNPDPTCNIENLQQEIDSLQSQLRETVKQNDLLQQRILTLCDQGGSSLIQFANDSETNQCISKESQPTKRTGSAGQASCQRSESENKTNLQDDQKRNMGQTKSSSLVVRTNTTLSHGDEQTSPDNHCESHLTGEPSSLAASSGHSAAPRLGAGDPIQALRSQLREKYESDKSSASFISRFAKIWK